MGIDPVDIAFRIRKQLGVELTQDECVFMCDTAGWLHQMLCAKLDGRRPAVPDLWSIQSKIQSWLTQQSHYQWWRVTLSNGRLDAVVPEGELETAWKDLSEFLGCPLPSLAYEGGAPRLPNYATIHELARWVARRGPCVVPPLQMEQLGPPLPERANWTNAEVWDELRQILVNALGVDPRAVVPEARLIEDLGMS